MDRSARVRIERTKKYARGSASCNGGANTGGTDCLRTGSMNKEATCKPTGKLTELRIELEQNQRPVYRNR